MQKNKSLYIDTEALSALALVKAGLIAPVVKLMNQKEAEEVDRNETIKYSKQSSKEKKLTLSLTIIK